MRRYSIKPRKCKKQLLNTGLDASKKVVHKAGENLGNKIAEAITNSNGSQVVKPDENPRNIEEIIFPPEKRNDILNKLRKAL